MTHFWDGSRSPGQKVKLPQIPNSQESHTQLPPSTRLSSTQKNLESPKQWASSTYVPTPTRHPHFPPDLSQHQFPSGRRGRCAGVLTPLHAGPPRSIATAIRGHMAQGSFPFCLFLPSPMDFTKSFLQVYCWLLHNLLLNLKPKQTPTISNVLIFAHARASTHTHTQFFPSSLPHLHLISG